MATITSKEQAFEAIENTIIGIPFEAIEYLYNYGQDPEIESRIIYYLSNAHNQDVVYDAARDVYLEAPLWYAIVAENHITAPMIDVIIGFYLTEENDWDFLNEQGVFLLGRSCEVLGDVAVEKYLAVIEEQVAKNSDYPYLFLFEALYYAEESKYKDRVLKLLDYPDIIWIDILASTIGDINYKSCLPRLKEVLSYHESKEDDSFWQNQYIVEIKAAIKKLESEDANSEKIVNQRYCVARSHWREYYSQYIDLFNIQEPEPVSTFVKKKKVGRNDPCPCGSGKKYKKCCL